MGIGDRPEFNQMGPPPYPPQYNNRNGYQGN